MTRKIPQTQRCPSTARTLAQRGSGQVKLSGLHPGGKRPPLIRCDRKPRPVRVFRVTDGNGGSRELRDLDAPAAVATAVARLAPRETASPRSQARSGKSPPRPDDPAADARH